MKCWAYKDDGTICGALAVAIDRQRGFAVCAEHALNGPVLPPVGEVNVLAVVDTNRERMIARLCELGIR